MSPPRTRGRTAPGRLAALDAWVCRVERALLERRDGPWATAPFVDIGLGDRPDTTLESAATFRTVRPDLRVVGVDHDPARVAAALPFGETVTGFVVGDAPPEPARLVRAFNVLRGTDPGLAAAAHARLGNLLPGGLFLEGTCDPGGHVLVSHLLRRAGDTLVREGLLFYTDFAQGFAPLLFRDRLPCDLRRVAPGTAMHAFLGAWTAAWAQTRESWVTPRERFVASVPGLATRVAGIDGDPWLVERGYVVWRPTGGVP